MTHTSDQAPGYRVDTQLVHAHGLAALITLLIAMVFGIIVSLQFIFPDLTGNWLPLGWGRLRYAHTQGIMLGWLGNAFFAFMPIRYGAFGSNVRRWPPSAIQTSRP